MSKKVQHDSATPAHGQQVICAVPFIHRTVNGVHEIFLAKRADTKAFLPGIYEMPGGHIDFGEDIVEGLRREVKEELGVDVTVGDSFACFTYVNEVKGSHSIQIGFFARFVGASTDIHLDPDDHTDAGWFSRKKLLDNVKTMRPNKSQKAVSLTQHDQGRDGELNMVLKGFDILEGKPLNLG